jgi:hypothetical protein
MAELWSATLKNVIDSPSHAPECNVDVEFACEGEKPHIHTYTVTRGLTMAEFDATVLADKLRLDEFAKMRDELKKRIGQELVATTAKAIA